MTAREVTPSGHQPRDSAAFIAVGLRPSKYQPREQAVMCFCGTRTWHLSVTCDLHYLEPAPVVDARARVEASQVKALDAVSRELGLRGDNKWDYEDLGEEDPGSPF